LLDLAEVQKPQPGRHDHDAGGDAPSGRKEPLPASICAHSPSVAARACGHIRRREPFPATPRGVAGQATASVLTRQKTLPAYDDSGPPWPPPSVTWL
jgi:hypothetical protein